MKTQRYLFTILVCLILAAVVLVFIKLGFKNNSLPKPGNESYPSPTNTETQRSSLSGEVICLPHKDQTGPQTLECAFGILADDGNNYSLNLGLMPQNPPEFKIGDTIKANGTMTPIEMISSDHLQKYDIVGIFFSYGFF